MGSKKDFEDYIKTHTITPYPKSGLIKIKKEKCPSPEKISKKTLPKKKVKS